MEIIIRKNLKSDENFILNSFLKSFRSNEQAKDIANKFYFEVLEQKIKRVLKQEDRCFVAVNSEDPDQIFGYILFKDLGGVLILDYVYTKDVFRGLKIATALINKVGTEGRQTIINTTKADTTRKKVLCQKLKSQYCPFLLFEE